MENLFEKLRELKTKAKNRRDLKRYESAATCANQAIQTLESALDSTDATEKSKLADQLADSYGLLGGIYRRWGLSVDGQQKNELLQKSFNAYNTGYEKYEKCEEYKIANSYNRLNRLVSYLLINPASFSDGPVDLHDGQTLTVKERLESAGRNIDQQLKLERRGDIWAIADLALVKLLLESETPMAAYADFIAASPADYVYDSALSVLRPLSALELPVASKLKDAAELLEGKLQQIRPSTL
jgi:hypothetical protein